MRKAVLFAILAGTLGLVIFDFMREERATGASTRPTPGAGRADTRAEGPSPSGAGGDRRQLTLPERSALGDSRTGLFSSHSWQSPASKSAAKFAAAPVAPSVPAMPYRFAGSLVQDGKLQVLLANGNTVIPVQQGETIDGGYRVELIGEDQITLIYLPLGKKQIIPFFSLLLPAGAVAQAPTAPAQVASQINSAVATADPAGGAVRGASARSQPVPAADPGGENKSAQLLWDGPRQVKLGTEFSVALRVTSAQPVRASPMQIRVNPDLLETVAVKPGRFFSEGDRNFSYRVSPDGSIFVGATSQNPTPAADAEFVVLTFRPLKAAPAAELSIASLNLQGPAGRAIAFDPLVAFKTAITP